jgi:hypothetical protein
MNEKSTLQDHCEETVAFNRRFKYAVIAFALVEFAVTAAVFIYKVTR